MYYIKDVIRFIKDVFNPDKKVKILNRGNKVIFKVLDKESYDKMEGTHDERKEAEERRIKEILEANSTASTRRSETRTASQPRQTNNSQELQGFSKRQRDRATQVIDPNEINNSTRYLSEEEQMEIFLRRMEKSQENKSVKVKKITK